MQRMLGHVRNNLVAYVALFVALTGTSAYAAATITSEDIVNGEVKTPDLAPQAVTRVKVAENAVNSSKVVDDSLTGADIQESSLALSFQGTANVVSARTAVPSGGASGQVVLDVPGFGQVQNKNCSVKSARSSFFNDTAKTVDVFTDASGATTSTDPLFARLAPGQETMGDEVEGTERAIYQASFGAGRVATVVVMGRPGTLICNYQAQAVVD
jgi:hypothetical protein